MPQPNKGTHGTPNTAAPIHDKSGAKSDDHIKTGVHTPGVGGSRGSYK